MTELVVTGQIEVSVPIELPQAKTNQKKLANILGFDSFDEEGIEGLAKFIVLEAVRSGLDNMKHRQSEPSDVSEYDLEVEEG